MHDTGAVTNEKLSWSDLFTLSFREGGEQTSRKGAELAGLVSRGYQE
jgi:hypothetical protein